MRPTILVALVCGCAGGGGSFFHGDGGIGNNEGDGGSKTIDTGAINAFGDLMAALGKVVCAEAYQCCANPQMDTQTANEAACAVGAAAALGGFFAQTVADIAGGKVGFDASKAQTCVSAFKMFQCTGERREFVDTTCYTYLIGKTAAGGACDGIGSATCAPGSGCWYLPTDHSRFVCTPLPAAGTSCVFGANLCDYTTGLTCGIENKCVALYADGHACAANGQCLSGVCQNEMCSRVTITAAVCNTNPTGTGGKK